MIRHFKFTIRRNSTNICFYSETYVKPMKHLLAQIPSCRSSDRPKSNSNISKIKYGDVYYPVYKTDIFLILNYWAME